jgi:hypothetical protein
MKRFRGAFTARGRRFNNPKIRQQTIYSFKIIKMLISHLYFENRKLFLDDARRAGVEVVDPPFILPDLHGPLGEVLATDVVLIGAPTAPNVVVISSGIHGVELPLGSELQRRWLAAAKAVCAQRKNIRFVFVHALNPYGAAHALRTDENNVDPNRNFIDFNKLPDTPRHYHVLADAFYPSSLGPFSIARSRWEMYSFIRKHGMPAFKQALAGGQYLYRNGLYHGGRQLSWTRRTWQTIVQHYVIADKPRNIWHIDIHSGDGPYGQLRFMVNTNEGSPLHERVKQFALPELTHSAFAFITGDIVDSWTQPYVLNKCTVTPLAIEAGTSRYRQFEGFDVLDAMIKRNVLKNRYGDQHHSAEKIKQTMQEMFAPTDPDWLAGALEQGDRFWARLMLYTPRPAS